MLAGVTVCSASARPGLSFQEIQEAPVLPPPTEPAGVPNRIDYEIRARVDGDTKVLDGQETLRWSNQTQDSVTDLWFHLYLNAFSNNRSTHLVESGGTARGRPFKNSWGWQRVTSIELVDFQTSERVDLLPTFQYRRPDDGNEDDRTTFSVDLPRAVQPGETIEVEITWESQLPRVRRRTGYKDDFMLVAQWFPKLGVYEEGRGWNAHQFHASTEFYSDYGSYDVTIDLPARYEGKVYGSGAPPTSRLKDDRVITRFVAPSREDQELRDHTGRAPVVHDFTWTADPGYEVFRYTFDAEAWLSDPDHAEVVAEARRAFGPRADFGLRDVVVTVLIQPERVAQAERHYDATATALFYYGLWFGGYPYEHITVIDPAWGARGAGGMEYPTLFTSGTRLFTTPDMHTPESVTVHEAGHQFFYGLVGNNEFESAWLDEGLNSYADSEALVRRYGPDRSTTDYSRIPVHGVRPASLPGGDWVAKLLAAREIPLPWLPNLKPLRDSGFVAWWRDQPGLTFASRWSDPRWGDRRGYLRNAWIDPVDTNAWQYESRSSYGTNSYPRPAVILRTLSGLVGREAFLRGMRHYSETWRYRHPTPEDFFATFQEGAGLEQDLDWFFRDLFQGTGTVDWSVVVEQKREPKPKGFFQEGERGEFLEYEADEDGDDEEEDEGAGEPADADSEAEGEDGKPKGRPWTIEIRLRREGELRLPLPVRLRFEDGSEQDFVWTRAEQAEKRWLSRELTMPSGSKLKSVRLDPERLYYIDTDMSNNEWHDEVDDVAPLRWSERVFSQFAQMLHWQARIGG